MGLQKKGAPIGIGVTPTEKIHVVASGAANKDLYIKHNLQSGTGLADIYRPVWLECNYTATDLATTLTAWGGINSSVTYGNSGVAATGKARALATTVTIQGAGNALNEYAAHYACMRADLGTGYTQTAAPTGRIWLTDWNVHGPIGIQPDMMNGQTIFFNNYYNGSPLDSPSAAVWLVTKKASGGSLDSGHQNADTYPVDVGLGIVGASDVGGTEGVGFTKAIQIGGFGSGWKESGTSRIGTGIDLRDHFTHGIHIHDRHASGTAFGIMVSANGGPVIIGSSAQIDANTKLEVISAGATVPIMIWGSTSGVLNHNIIWRNGQGQHSFFVVGTAGTYLTGTVAGDAGIRPTTAGKMFHLGGTTKVVTFTLDNKLGFFAATPVVQQTGGVATADTTWSANEVTMLQAAYDCLRTFGLLS